MINDLCKKEYAVALGCFDGLHTAHMAVINEAARLSSEGLLPAVMLFDEHPRNVIAENGIPCLLQKDKRETILKNAGFHIFTVSFREIKDMSPEEFVRDVLVGSFHSGAVVCGYNYRFGKNGAGDSEKLRALCKEYGIAVSVCPEFVLDGKSVSSTRIRKAVEEGRISDANKMLGYEFTYSSEIFTGDRRGRLLGAPTINQYLPEGLVIPRFGVYASKVNADGKEYLGVTNIGSRPTFDGKSVRSETYIIDYSGDLYGKTVTVSLFEFIRDEKKFPDADTLKMQISEDVKKTLLYFSDKN